MVEGLKKSHPLAVLVRVLRVVMIEGKAVFDADAVDEIVAALRRGGLVVYPTDTLYALGADPFDADAVARIFAAKARPPDQPLSVVVEGLETAKRLAVIPPGAEPFVRQWLPGPLTLVFRPSAGAPKPVLSSDGKIAIRVPNHAVPLVLAKRFGPITATSANRHGKPAALEAWQAAEQLGESVDVYIDAGPCPVGLESTIVDFTGPDPRIIREGAVSAARLGLVRRNP